MDYPALNYSPPPCQFRNNVGFNSKSNDCSASARAQYAPGYEGVKNSDVARDFARNFSYFEEGYTGFATRQGISDYAHRPLGSNPEENQRIMLARHIDTDPVLSHALDSMLQGRADGRISMGDVLAAIEMFEAQERSASNYASPPNNQRANFGAMQQHRVNNQYNSYSSGQPPTMQQPWAGNQYYPQYPEQPQMQSRSNYIPQSSNTGPGPYSHEEKKDFSPRLLAHFAALEDPSSPGNITDRSLNYVVSTGQRPDGSPASQEDIAIAKEVLDNRPKDFRKYDEADGVLDGKISRSSIAAEMDRSGFSTMSDVDLLKIIKEHFSEFRGNDGYASVNDLREAAGQIPSTRTFTPEARQAAAELLGRPTLLTPLDVGTNNKGGDGYLDQRFDLDNLNYMIQKLTIAAAG